MTIRFLSRVALAAMALAWASTVGSAEVQPAPNGLTLPPGYKDWKLIGVSHRTDNNSLRAIIGNEIAVNAARSGRTNPWPDGTVLGKLVWNDATHERWASATVPGEFVHAEFMVRDQGKYVATGGWGFARWLGKEQKPYGSDASFAQECFNCHTAAKDTDHVFTRPGWLP